MIHYGNYYGLEKLEFLQSEAFPKIYITNLNLKKRISLLNLNITKSKNQQSLSSFFATPHYLFTFNTQIISLCRN